MSYLRKVLSRQQIKLLKLRGATVTGETIDATDTNIIRSVGRGYKKLLDRRSLRGVAIVRVALNSKIGFGGNSLTSARGFAGYADWTLFYLRGRFYPKTIGSNGLGPTGWNQGVTGNTSTMLAARLQNFWDENFTVGILEIGTNDFGGGGSVATFQTKAEEAIAGMESRGIVPFVVTILPRASANWVSSGAEAKRLLANAWLRTRIPAARLVETDDIIEANTTYLNADLVHLIGTGAQRVGKRLASKIEAYAASEEIFGTAAANLYTNPTLSGGTTVATSWTFFQATNGLTKAASKETFEGRVWQRYTSSGTCSSAVADNFNQNVTPPGGLAGELYEAWCDVIVRKATGLAGMSISAGTNGGNTTHMSITSQDPSPIEIPEGGLRGVLRCPPSTLGSNGATFNSRISILPAVGASRDIEFLFSRPEYRKVPA